MTAESDSEAVIVFEGSKRACSEAALVLEAKDIPFAILTLGARWGLQVPGEAATGAREELSRYALERVPRPRPVTVLVPFDGAGWGAAGYVLVLLVAAYCAGIQAFGADWLARGSLDAHQRDWWRPITALTLHLDQAHLLGNLLFGVGIGMLAGRAFGPGVAWLGIVAAAAAANLAEMLVSPPTHRSVGASTAVFAALGLLAGFGWRHGLELRDRFKHAYGPLFGGVGLLALLGAGDQHVDVLGHVLGFVCGLALGWWYSRRGLPRNPRLRGQVAAGAASCLIVGLAWYGALRR